MRTSNWAGSWYPPTGQPLGQGFLEMCPMVPSKHSFAQVPCTGSLHMRFRCMHARVLQMKCVCYKLQMTCVYCIRLRI